MIELEDMTLREIKKYVAQLGGNTKELNDIRIMLSVRCRGALLCKLGIRYYDSKSVLSNVRDIVTSLVEKIDAKSS